MGGGWGGAKESLIGLNFNMSCGVCWTRVGSTSLSQNQAKQKKLHPSFGKGPESPHFGFL